jgi:hypothetical protein
LSLKKLTVCVHAALHGKKQKKVLASDQIPALAGRGQIPLFEARMLRYIQCSLVPAGRT